MPVDFALIISTVQDGNDGFMFVPPHGLLERRLYRHTITSKDGTTVTTTHYPGFLKLLHGIRPVDILMVALPATGKPFETFLGQRVLFLGPTGMETLVVSEALVDEWANPPYTGKEGAR